MIEAIVLGSGTSSGVPILGVDYSESFLSNPKNHRTRSSLLLKGPEGNVLIDAGPDMRMQLLRENIKNIDAVIITHTHADHVMGLDDLRAFTITTKKPMPLYTSVDYQNQIKRIFEYAFIDNHTGVSTPKFDLRDTGDHMNICGIEMEIMWLIHGRSPVLGVRVNNFAYLTDVSEIPEHAWNRLQNLDILVLDAVRSKPHPNHFHLEKAIEVARELGAKKTYFTHLSDEYDHDVTNSQLPDGFELAYDGLRINIQS